MTDAILVKPDGTFTVGKSISRRESGGQLPRIGCRRRQAVVWTVDGPSSCAADIYTAPAC